MHGRGRRGIRGRWYGESFGPIPLCQQFREVLGNTHHAGAVMVHGGARMVCQREW